MKPKPTRRDVLIPAAVFLAAFGYLYLFHRLGWFMEDEGVLYYQYLRVYDGEVPYRDFFTGYGPLVYYLHAWAFTLFGISINAIRILTAVVNATTAAGLYAVTRRLTSRGFALIPPVLFLVMQPGDIAVMVFHNSPYPSWYAIGFAVWGTWSLLRFLEAAQESRRIVWLVITGVLGGLTFLSKQNAGTFFLWGASGFLASRPHLRPAASESEPLLARCLRVGYLMLIPLAALDLIKNFVGVATVVPFVIPVATLALIGARQRFGLLAVRLLVRHFTALAAGVGAAIAPWLAYFTIKMGFLPFVRVILFLGADVDRNLYIPFPRPTPATLLLLGPLTAWALLAWLSQRRATSAHEPIRLLLRGLTVLTAVLFLGAAASQVSVLRAVLQFHYNLWQIYSFASDGLDNLAAYLSLLTMAAALLLAWQHARRTTTRHPAHEAFLCVLWIAACSFILYYPRMDYAHLVGALPPVYVVAAALLPRLRNSARFAFGSAEGRLTTLAFNAACGLLVVFVACTKSAPKVYSRTMLARTPYGITFIATPTEWLHLDRADLYFPIYLPRQRLHVQAIRDLIQYLRNATPKREPLFAFPALSMVYFLSGRDNPTRHDYFLGDNVDFREQLDVIRTLQRERVPTVVLVNAPTDYFVAKGRDFTRTIWEYLRRGYYLDRRFGPYDVLRRYGSQSEGAEQADLR